MNGTETATARTTITRTTTVELPNEIGRAHV